jgi:predicted nucleic acid-binding protein
MSGMTESVAAPRIYLDANIFIFFFQGSAPASEWVKVLLAALKDRPGIGVTSELSVAEVLVGVEHSPLLKRAYLDLIVWSNIFDLVPVSRDILYESARMRVAHKEAHGKKLKLPDAIHLSSAAHKGCRHFISADDGIKPPNGMMRLSPIADSADEILKVLS